MAKRFSAENMGAYFYYCGKVRFSGRYYRALFERSPEVTNR